ncbi:hypothetical protein LBMAG20_10730 [Methylocystaceae bacterium]|nr:hypothetical protein LBMAG20_10730 [Methylocystaceae bacterium]
MKITFNSSVSKTFKDQGRITNAIQKNLVIIIAGYLIVRPALAQELSDNSEIIINCDSCHNGVSAEDPDLRGQQQKYLEAQLEKFRNNKRVHSLMSIIGRNLSDEQLKELAKYYSQNIR